MSAEDIATAFVQHYYQILDSAPTNLASLYQPQSTLTFEGQKLVGPNDIVGKWASLGKLTHDLTGMTKDVQMSVSETALLIFITGRLKLGEDNPLLFSHMFQLVATGPGQYYVHNEVFRLMY